MRGEMKARTLVWVFVGVRVGAMLTLWYVIVCLLAYNIRHPDLTPMRVLFDIWEALQWK